MKDMHQIILLICLILVLCEKGMKILEEPEVIKMDVNANNVLTIKLMNKSTKRKYWNLVNKDKLNSTSITFIKQGNAKGP